MSASSPLPSPLFKRIPPGLWTALVWVVAAVQPIVQYVLVPHQHAYSLSYPQDGLDALTARALLALALLLVLTGSALLRRRAEVAYGLVLVGTVVLSVAWRQDEALPLQFLGVDVALCHVAATRPRRTAITATAGALGVLTGYLALRWITGRDPGTASEPFIALTVVIAWLVGNSIHQARTHTAELHARVAAQAVTAERLRIAREMHDTVAHSIGIIALQAGAAARVVETQPARAREAMITVEHVGRDTLAGLRRMLGALRQADQGQADQGHAQAPLRPAVGLADLEQLAATTTAAGVRVEVRWQGERRPLPTDVDLAALRIVQEAVTNVVRHATVDHCQVKVEYREDELLVEVVDRGKGCGTNTKNANAKNTNANTKNTDTGFGLVGMRERVALLDGHFTAGPRPGGGFRVAARLPVPVPTAAGTEPEVKAGAR
ncbi:sensor histidine kinase [Streptomyces sp. NBC_00356]|uniref:sensor histidine kinase n=1 Tax=Streptomyces sp. NBC_00356 TaxID=2975724 RepID=UPI002E268388